MKNLIIIFSIIGTSAFCSAQVGIGTTTPQGTLHIDAGKNTTAGTPATNFNDDVVVTSTGNVGIGTLTPATKLEINSPTAGAIRIVDGTQGANKVLVSDANGVGTWQVLPVFKNAINGSFTPSATVSSDNTSTLYKSSNGTITLNKGKWLVSAGLTIKLNNTTGTNNSKPYWLQLYLSDTTTSVTNTKFTYIGNVPKNFGGNIIRSLPDNSNFPTGSTIIDVLQDNTTIYLLIQNVSTDSSGNNIGWVFSTGNYENYFNAVPTN